MPTYPYRCTSPDCGLEFEVVKAVAHIDDPERCEHCASRAERYISRTHFYGASDWDKAEWNPGLGCVTRGARHRAQVAREMGVEEIGSTDINSIHRDMDTQRERRREQRWAEA